MQCGVVCCKIKKFVYFLSTSFMDFKVGCAQIEKKLMAVTFSNQKLHNNFYGNYIDH